MANRSRMLRGSPPVYYTETGQRTHNVRGTFLTETISTLTAVFYQLMAFFR